MLISTNELGEMAGRFIEVLARQGIDSTPKVDVHLGKKIPIMPTLDYLEISLSHSNDRTKAYRIEYVAPNIGTPLTLRINPDLSYSKIILKAEELLSGYTPFVEDDFGNVVQDKRVNSADLQDSLKEIEMLRSLANR